MPIAFDDRQALEVSQAAIGRQIGDYRFVDHRGRALQLAGLRGRPLIISMIYTGCYQTCPLTTENLARAVALLDRNIGAERYRIATIGFNTTFDTPDHMAAFAHGHGIDRPGWFILSGDFRTVRAITDDLGFTYFPSPRGIDHLVQTTVLDGEGRVYRQIYGTDVSERELTAAVNELLSGRPVEFRRSDGWIDRLLLLCSAYDPERGRYRVDFDFLITLAIGGTGLAAVGVFLVRAWRNASAERRV